MGSEQQNSRHVLARCNWGHDCRPCHTMRNFGFAPLLRINVGDLQPLPGPSCERIIWEDVPQCTSRPAKGGDSDEPPVIRTFKQSCGCKGQRFSQVPRKRPIQVSFGACATQRVAKYLCSLLRAMPCAKEQRVGRVADPLPHSVER